MMSKLLEIKKRNKTQTNPSPITMQTAISQRQAQGRGVLDHWDMFANVMTTRHELDSKDPHYLSKLQIAQETVKEVNKATNQTMPDHVEIDSINGAHAFTGGGWYQRDDGFTNKPTTIAFDTTYLSNALKAVRTHENTDLFRKFVRTASHEMTHVEQRLNKDFMQTSNTDQRERDAYASEVLHHPSLPALRGNELDDTVGKLKYHLNKLEDTSLKKRLRTVLRMGKGRGL